jgi:hypothetical protein
MAPPAEGTTAVEASELMPAGDGGADCRPIDIPAPVDTIALSIGDKSALPHLATADP